MAFTLSYLGLSCFRIQTKVQNEEVTILTDPFDPGKTGLKLPRNLAANVVMASSKTPEHGATGEVSGPPPFKGVSRYNVRIEGGDVEVEV